MPCSRARLPFANLDRKSTVRSISSGAKAKSQWRHSSRQPPRQSIRPRSSGDFSLESVPCSLLLLEQKDEVRVLLLLRTGQSCGLVAGRIGADSFRVQTTRRRPERKRQKGPDGLLYGARNMEDDLASRW